MISFNVIPGASFPSMNPQLKITFNFNFEYIEDQDSIPHSIDSASSSVVVGEALSFEKIGEAVEDATFQHLHEEERDKLIDFAWKEVSRIYPTIAQPTYKILYICIQIRIQYRLDCMIPASDSSFALLDKYDVGRVEEGCCCICLEELAGDGDGGGALKMPCSHVFHGGCIEEWLTTSHYCPLCRYEMPTE